ncbi:Spc24-domain-containing protein [Ascodesmis nigricans]|uniref:Kinetochore protein Spc24 n=1 Tax=Ascodesmis nigricans TaxID=341454 RepID=A0A4V3SJN7_9PEZI|nr:Spc24-domain-containing protein [Ascodesmis nigricans]
MPILDDDPCELLASLVDNFDIRADTRSLTRITDNLTQLRTTREKIVIDQRNVLRLLSRKAEVAESSLQSSLSAAKERKHSEKMLTAEREKFNLAKAVNELESTTHALEGQLARLRKELEGIEAVDVLKEEVEGDDGITLKLRLYRSLGIELEEDEAGVWTKAVVRNPRKGEVGVIKIEDGTSPAFYADYFWKQLG